MHCEDRAAASKAAFLQANRPRPESFAEARRRLAETHPETLRYTDGYTRELELERMAQAVEGARQAGALYFGHPRAQIVEVG